MTGAGGANPNDVRPAEVRFDALSEAWGLFQKQMTTWIISALIVGVLLLGCGVVVSVVSTVILRTIAGVSAHGGLGGVGIRFVGFWIVTLVRLAIDSFIFGLLSSPLFRLATRQVRGEPISINDIFGVTDVLGPIVVGAFIVGLIHAIGFMMCIIPGLIAGGVLMLTYPLIVDQRLGAIEAMKQSWNALRPHFLMAILFYTVVVVAVVLGGCVTCGLGGLILGPLAVLSVTVVYRDFFLAGAYPAQTSIPMPPGGMPPPPAVG